MATRRVHVVRIKQPNNPSNYVDVKVIDAIAYRGPNGFEALLRCDAINADPYIKDKTEDGNTKGNPQGCSRSSSIVRVGASGGGSMLDVEQLNAVCFQAPNNKEVLLVCPGDSAAVAVVDTTGNGLTVDASDSTTRATHIEKISDTSGSGRYLLVERVDAISFRGPNGLENLMFNPGEGSEIDTTRYNSDGSPPDNKDPNLYIFWPPGATDPWIGNTQGASGVIRQGPLWWIVKASAGSTLLLLIQVNTAGIGDPQSVALKGLPFLTSGGLNIAVSPSGPPLAIAASGASGPATVTDPPTADMLSGLYLWTTPYQFQFIEPPLDDTFDGIYLYQAFSSVNYCVLNLGKILADFPLAGASGASGATGPTWDGTFSIDVPQLPGTIPTGTSQDTWIVWFTNSFIENGGGPFATNQPFPLWFAVFSNDSRLPVLSNNQIYQIIQGFIQPGIPGGTPVRVQGGAAEANSLASFLAPRVEFPVFVTESIVPATAGGQSASNFVTAGIFQNIFIPTGATGASGGAVPPPTGGRNQPPGLPFSQNFLQGNEGFNWYDNGITPPSSGDRGLPSALENPYAVGAQPGGDGVALGVLIDVPPGIGATGATGASGGASGGTGIGPISAAATSFLAQLGGLPGRNVVFKVAQGATGASGASGGSGASGPAYTIVLTAS